MINVGNIFQLGFVELFFFQIGIPWDSSPFFATIWETMFGTFLQASNKQSQVKINIKHQNTLEDPLHNIKTRMNEHRKMLLWQNVSSFLTHGGHFGFRKFQGKYWVSKVFVSFFSRVGFPVHLCVCVSKDKNINIHPRKLTCPRKRCFFSVANTPSNHWFVRGHVSFAGQYHTMQAKFV